MPRAGRTEVGGVRDGRLVVRVPAAPAAGAANLAVVRAVARACGVAPSAVRIEGGERSRAKRVSLPASCAVALARLAERAVTLR